MKFCYSNDILDPNNSANRRFLFVLNAVYQQILPCYALVSLWVFQDDSLTSEKKHKLPSIVPKANIIIINNFQVSINSIKLSLENEALLVTYRWFTCRGAPQKFKTA